MNSKSTRNGEETAAKGRGSSGDQEPVLGLRQNLAQFSLLVLVNAFVGGMVGLERAILPLIAEREFGLVSKSVILSFIVGFGFVKAFTNLAAGRFSDRIGRKGLLVGGWIVGLPVPFLLMWAPSWGWITAANFLLGINQGLCWSTTVIMKIDLVGPQRRGFAMGLNEFAGYFAVAITALASGYIAAAYGLRPAPFYLGIGIAGAGLLLSVFFVRETHGHARHEAKGQGGAVSVPFKEIFARTSYRDPNLFSCSQAGMVNNLNDGMAWGLFPLFFAAAHLSVERIAVLAATYPAVWGICQLFTGALSDRVGRKWMIACGMWVQAGGIGLIAAASSFSPWVTGAVLLGVGTAMVYPTLLAAIGDVAHPSWRASAVGVYRLWRDAGYAFGALLSGIIADLLGVVWAIAVVGVLTLASGLVVALRMSETLVPRKMQGGVG
jgi:MFS family permease